MSDARYVAFAIFLLVVGLPIRLEVRGKHRRQTGEDPADDRQPASQRSEQLPSSHPGRETTSAEEREHRAAEKVYWVLSLILTAFAVAGAIGSAFLAINLWTTSHEQLIAFREQERTQLRAYLGPAFARLTQIKVGSQIGVATTIKNFGLTPAYHVVVKGISELQTTSSTGRYHIFDYAGQSAEVDQIIYPGQDIISNTSQGNPLTDNQMFLVATARVLVYTHYGSIYWTDTFGQGWHSDFCYYFGSAEVTNSNFQQCHNHNTEGPGR